MKKIFIISLIITFFTTQYTYLQASCLLCDQSGEMLKITVVERPEPEEIEFMFDHLKLNEKIEFINNNETYKLEYMGTEFIYVSLYDKNSYLLAIKEGNLIGAVNHHDGGTSIILPEDIQLELICVMTCFLVWGRSSISIIGCLLMPLAIIFYPTDKGFLYILFTTCFNGLLGIISFLNCSAICY